ncbi:MAG: hypothetical protein AABW84_02505 [Nanoarchaeota archaeon]
MVYVDTCKKLSDPKKVGRLYHLLKPFLPKDWEPQAASGLKRNEIKNYFLLAEAFIEHHPLAVKMLDSYKLQHELSLKKLSSLKHKDVLLIPGISPDNSKWKVSYIGHDIFSDRFKLTTEILESINHIDQKYNVADFLENLLIIPVSPFFFPGDIMRLNRGDLALHYAFPDIYLEVNEILKDTKKKPLKSTYKLKFLGQSEEIKGMTEFSDLIFSYSNSVKAKQARYKKLTEEEIKEDMYELRYTTHINRQIMRRSLETILSCFGKPANLFAKKTSYVRSIIDERFIEDFKIYDIGDDKGPLANAGMTNQAEADDSAQNILKGWLKSYGTQRMS